MAQGRIAVPGLAVRLEGLRKAYPEGGGRREVLRGVDLELAPGERAALLGPSGCGKTTLLHLLGALDRPDAGRIRVGDLELTAAGEAALTRYRRRALGLVFQEGGLLPTLTVLENLLLPLELNARLNGRLRRREAGRSAMALLRRLDLQAAASRYPESLSGGERQRLAVARAVIHGPGLVLADEPTGSLDGARRREVLALLGELAAERGSTVLVAT
ncbi:MAG: ATP-binding cassette domain-containing protein, partial [Gammaproteobacteria bacterium]